MANPRKRGNEKNVGDGRVELPNWVVVYSKLHSIYDVAETT